MHPSAAPPVDRSLDWDAMLTLGLTLGAILLTGGIAYGFALGRVLQAARTTVLDATGGTWLLVPGKRLANDWPDRDFQERLRCAAALAARPPVRPILILGGLTGDARISEAAAGESFLRTLPGGHTLQIYGEASSRNTLTNLRNVREMLAAWSPGATVTLISNRYHLARIGLIAASLGIGHRLWPAEPGWRPDRTTRLHLLTEGLFYLWFLVGKGWATLIRSRRMLGRVT